MKNGEQDSKNSLDIKRHSTAHILASALYQIFPDAKFGIGPVIENGFYYDVELPRTLIPEDLPLLEEKMKSIIKANTSFERIEISIDEARKRFDEINQHYKVEILDDLKVKDVKTVSLYKTGDFVDLCHGPHVDSAGEIKWNSFKLDKISGAYWKGDEKREQLQRIYGLSFETKDELKNFLEKREEVKKRDHRKIGADQELFFIDEMVGKGLVMWLPKGTILKNEVEKLAIELEDKAQYKRVTTPHLAKEELYITSGHLPYYKDDMYPAMKMDDATYYLRAMNCPHHHRIYSYKPKSYRDLPQRIAEYGTVYRNERSGTLAGLLRVRGLAMNDAHIYCRKDQIKKEFKDVMKLTMNYFEIFGLQEYWFRLSKWDPARTDKYINEPENWKYSQDVLREVLEEMKVPFIESDDEAAFYGPKVDVQFKSVLGREETMSTIQLDFLAKERFKLNYTDQEGNEKNEVFVIHRAPLSTHERFIAFLIEHFAGKFPTWLSPVHVAIIPVSDKFSEYGRSVEEQLNNAHIRTEFYNQSETLGKRIREAQKQFTPYMLIVGEKEQDTQTVSVRTRNSQNDGPILITDFITKITKEISDRQ